MSRWMNDYFHLYIFNVEYLKEKHTKQLYNSPFVTLIKCRQRFNADCPKEKKKYYRKQISRKGSFPQNHLKSYCMLILLNSKWYKRESNHRPNLFEKKKIEATFHNCIDIVWHFSSFLNNQKTFGFICVHYMKQKNALPKQTNLEGSKKKIGKKWKIGKKFKSGIWNRTIESRKVQSSLKSTSAETGSSWFSSRNTAFE